MANLIQNISEAIHVQDEKRSTGSIVVSDIYIGSADLSQADFDAKIASGSAVGYEAFKNFIAGNYQYQNAIFKAGLSSKQSDLPRLRQLQAYIDVPDVFDRGTATTSSSGVVTVTCNRAFYNLTEVTSTLKGGTVIASPRVSNIRSAGGVGYFDVELIDSTNTRVVGQVSWAAKGY